MQVISGVVLQGKRRGSELGYPTANIALSDLAVQGIYAAIVTFDGEEHAAAVFADPARKLLEAHLLDFSGDLYGKEISIRLIKKMREIQIFADDAVLKRAIADDVHSVRECLTV